jgi:hypothetical protein
MKSREKWDFISKELFEFLVKFFEILLIFIRFKTNFLKHVFVLKTFSLTIKKIIQ